MLIINCFFFVVVAIVKTRPLKNTHSFPVHPSPLMQWLLDTILVPAHSPNRTARFSARTEMAAPR